MYIFGILKKSGIQILHLRILIVESEKSVKLNFLINYLILRKPFPGGYYCIIMYFLTSSSPASFSESSGAQQNVGEMIC